MARKLKVGQRVIVTPKNTTEDSYGYRIRKGLRGVVRVIEGVGRSILYGVEVTAPSFNGHDLNGNATVSNKGFFFSANELTLAI